MNTRVCVLRLSSLTWKWNQESLLTIFRGENLPNFQLQNSLLSELLPECYAWSSYLNLCICFRDLTRTHWNSCWVVETSVRTSGRFVWSITPFLGSWINRSPKRKLSSLAGAPPSDTGGALLAASLPSYSPTPPWALAAWSSWEQQYPESRKLMRHFRDLHAESSYCRTKKAQQIK